jgi:2-hydroxychromene-2-carboxylate isomerase
VFFNFRSPYCYLASKIMFDILERNDAALDWRPLAGWDGRSPPERAKVKVPLVRQDVARFCRRMGIAFKPPPPDCDGTLAALVSLHAAATGKLQPFVVATMHAEWGEGLNIGDMSVVTAVAASVGLSASEVAVAAEDRQFAARLAANWDYAASKGIIGVPSFLIGDEVFWGNDRLDFVDEHLRGLAVPA